MEETTLTLPQMLSEKQAARVLAVSTSALRKWRRLGGGPAHTHLGRCIRYDLRAIENFLEENTSGKGANGSGPSLKP